MSRPQVSIDRLPRRLSIEPRESMNCKSCRKRKIKCTRMRPSCEACRVFQCPCVYDAVPKKRGSKTDVLEALLKRVDGLEKRLQDKTPVRNGVPRSPVRLEERSAVPRIDAATSFSPSCFAGSQIAESQNGCAAQQDFLSPSILNAYFARIHGKPYYILDESVTRRRYKADQLPLCLAMAIHAITIRYANDSSPVTQSLEHALQARRMVDIDNPTIEGLQTLLLLAQAFFAHGFGKKAYMTFSNCVAMAMALELHRELPSQVNSSVAEQEMRRRLFWAAYLMDCFMTCGSKRPCLITGQPIALRLPSFSNAEGDMFNPFGANTPRRSGQSPAASTLLIDITRILRLTNQYLISGGLGGDSHFHWKSHSSLSKVRHELDLWAVGAHDIFTSMEALFGHPEENTTLLLSKLIYHLIHCLLYRPFLPLDLLESRETGQQPAWQIEATHLCFSHANAITELVELGRTSIIPIEWPALAAYCIYIAGTVHVHGIHYGGSRVGSLRHCDGEVHSSSAELFAREINQLCWLSGHWTGVQHQRHTLQGVNTCHAELMRTLGGSPLRFSPVFHLEDFMDRYAGVGVGVLDTAHVRLVDDSQSQSPLAIHPQEPMPVSPYSPVTGLSPEFSASPTQHAPFSFDASTLQNQSLASSQDQLQILTPDTRSQTQSSPQGGSDNDTMEKDPFLSMLEQITENEQDSVGANEWRGFSFGGDDEKLGDEVESVQ